MTSAYEAVSAFAELIDSGASSDRRVSRDRGEDPWISEGVSAVVVGGNLFDFDQKKEASTANRMSARIRSFSRTDFMKYRLAKLKCADFQRIVDESRAVAFSPVAHLELPSAIRGGFSEILGVVFVAEF